MLVDRHDARRGLEGLFAEVREVQRYAESRAVEEEQDVRIYLARRPRQSIETVWPQLGPRWD